MISTSEIKISVVIDQKNLENAVKALHNEFKLERNNLAGNGGEIMLILTRRVGEALMVGDDTKIVVLGVKGSQIRLGINAPKDVKVHREEIYEKINVDTSETATK